MNPSSGFRKIGPGVFIATLLLFGGWSFAQEPSRQSRWVQSVPGTPVDGLQLAVSLSATTQPFTVPLFRVELRNVGERDLLLNLGTVSITGQQYPTAVSLSLTDAHGDSQRLQRKTFSVPNGPGTKPLLLPLPAGASFSFPVDLRDYWALGNKEFSPKLKPGTYSREAQFAGLDSGHLMPTAAELPPLDPTQMPFDMVYASVTGIPTIPTSNEIHFRVALP
jgi:hypothetical protein